MTVRYGQRYNIIMPISKTIELDSGVSGEVSNLTSFNVRTNPYTGLLEADVSFALFKDLSAIANQKPQIAYLPAIKIELTAEEAQQFASVFNLIITKAITTEGSPLEGGQYVAQPELIIAEPEVIEEEVLVEPVE